MVAPLPELGRFAEPALLILIVTTMLLFPAGWVALGVSALRVDRAGATFEGASRSLPNSRCPSGRLGSGMPRSPARTSAGIRS